jgi:predicted CopG family antitoxin
MGVIDIMDMQAEHATTISVRSSTRERLESLKTGGQSYDDVIDQLLNQAEDPEWLEEMGRRILEHRSGKVEAEPIERLWQADQRARHRVR